MRTEINYVEEIKDGPKVTLPYEGARDGEGVVTDKVGDRWVVSYLAEDRTAWSFNDVMGDCMGHIYTFRRGASREEHEKGYRALGRSVYGEPDDEIQPNPYAFLLDCFAHGSEHWSIHGEGMQCQWDTARGAGVWVPDECLMEEIKDRKEAEVYCRQFLEQYNQWINGEVYGIVTAWYSSTGEQEDYESSWMYVGYKHARESMLAQHASWCHSLQLTYDEEVRTSCGRQLEMEF